MEPIILASASPRRKELLSQARIPFIIRPSDFNETLEMTGSPAEIAEALAYFKALDVAKKTDRGMVLGADTIVVLDDMIFGKPADDDEAYFMLSRLNGHEHSVITGVALIDSEKGTVKKSHELTKVRFAELSQEEIRYYISTGEPEGKAGAYAVQGIGAMLVESIDGCYSNVVGLPLLKLRRMLEDFNIHVMSNRK
ncbi:MAG: septum formation inhibitor Maf [Ruminiclostridium sp.]|nr:septum formation inhibitor Maf [Ruminiclostridium sp.]